MALLTHREFEARYGDIARRLFDFDRGGYAPGFVPDLMFRRPLDWPVIPLPGSFDDMCRDADEQRNLEDWLGYFRGRLFDDSVVPRLYRWFFEREARRILWAPTVETLARRGSGRAAVFEPEGKSTPVSEWPGWTDPSRIDGWPVDMTADEIRSADQWTGRTGIDGWRAGEDTIAEGLPLQFEGWVRGVGDCVCLIDDSAAWALHSWGLPEISYLTAEPVLMEDILDAVGGVETVGKFFSVEYGMNDEFRGAPESSFEVFRQPPFVEMPLCIVPWLGDHLEAHAWLDRAFADL